MCIDNTIIDCCNIAQETESFYIDEKHVSWYEPRTISISGDFFSYNRKSEKSFGIGLSYTTQKFEDLWFLGKPSLEVGGMINTCIDNKISMFYAGLTWDIFLTDALFLTLDFGGVVHNGNTSKTSSRKNYGSKLLFREQIGIGYRLYEAEDYSLEGKLNIGHASHAGLGGSSNPGLDFITFELQYRFHSY